MTVVEFGNQNYGGIPGAPDFRAIDWNGDYPPSAGYGGPNGVSISGLGVGPNGGVYGIHDLDDRGVNLNEDGGQHNRIHMIGPKDLAPFVSENSTAHYCYSIKVPSGGGFVLDSNFKALEIHQGGGVAPFLNGWWRGSDGKLRTNLEIHGGTATDYAAHSYRTDLTKYGASYGSAATVPWKQLDGTNYPGGVPTLPYDTWHHFRFGWSFKADGTGWFEAYWYDNVQQQWVNIVPRVTNIYNAFPSIDAGGMTPYLSLYYDSTYTGPSTYNAAYAANVGNGQSYLAFATGRNRQKFYYAAGAFASVLAERDFWQGQRLGALIQVTAPPPPVGGHTATVSSNVLQVSALSISHQVTVSSNVVGPVTSLSGHTLFPAAAKSGVLTPALPT